MSLNKFWAALAALSWWFAAPLRLLGQTSEPPAWHSLYEKSEFVNSADEKLLYRIMRPEKIEEERKYPLVLFLHGADERGNDNTAQLVHGLKEFAQADRRAANPAFVIAPQCPRGHKWVDVPWNGVDHPLPEEPSLPLRLCRELLERTKAELPLDESRIYIVGLSMGGFGTFDAICRWPDLFAAAVPVCGGGDHRVEIAERFKSLPLWAFHGDQDRIVPVENTRKMIAALREAGGEPRYTEYQGVDHDSWSRTFADDELHHWLFKQHR